MDVRVRSMIGEQLKIDRNSKVRPDEIDYVLERLKVRRDLVVMMDRERFWMRSGRKRLCWGTHSISGIQMRGKRRTGIRRQGSRWPRLYLRLLLERRHSYTR